MIVTATLASYKPNTAFLKYMYIYSFAAYFFCLYMAVLIIYSFTVYIFV